MKLHHIAVNNLRRRKAKMAFLIFGMVIGIATIVSLYTVAHAMEAEIADKFDQIGSNMTLVPKTDNLSYAYEGVSAADVVSAPPLMSMADVEKIYTIKNRENIASVAPKLLETLDIEGKPRLVMGIDFKSELRMKRWWKVQGRSPQKTDELLLGSEAARELALGPGGTLMAGGRTFRVAGVIAETGNQEDNVFFMDLPTLQTLAGKPGAVSYVEVAALCYTCPIEDISDQIANKLPGVKVSAVREVLQARQDFVDRFSTLGTAVSAIVLVIGSLVVLITMMSSVNERTREIGIFRAAGFCKSHIMRIILMEAGLVSLAGGIIGFAAGMAAARIGGPVLAQMEVGINWDYRVGLAALGLALFMGLLAGFLPAYRASRQDPVEALRFI